MTAKQLRMDFDVNKVYPVADLNGSEKSSEKR